MTDYPTPRILLPSFLAGPMVLLLLMIAVYADNIPQPIELLPGMILGIPVMLLMSMIVGTLPALVCNAVGTYLLIIVGSISPLLRFPFLWPLVGGAATWLVVRSLDFNSEWAFAFIGTGAVSAMICRMRLA